MFTSNTTMVFLPGDHVLDRKITVANVARLTMWGDSSSDRMATVVCNESVGFSFTIIRTKSGILRIVQPTTHSMLGVYDSCLPLARQIEGDFERLVCKIVQSAFQRSRPSNKLTTVSIPQGTLALSILTRSSYQ